MTKPAVKTVTSLTFTNLDDQYRVGFHTLSNGLTTSTAQSDPATFVNIADFDATQKTALIQKLLGDAATRTEIITALTSDEASRKEIQEILKKPLPKK